MIGDLGGLGEGPPQNLSWGNGPCIRPPVLSDAYESTNCVKKVSWRVFSREDRDKNGSYTCMLHNRFQTVKPKKKEKKYGRWLKNVIINFRREMELFNKKRSLQIFDPRKFLPSPPNSASSLSLCVSSEYTRVAGIPCRPSWSYIESYFID